VAKQRDLTQQHFDQLLLWLDPDRERAALKYGNLHASLIKIFQWRGCNDAESLVDETFDRVAARVKDVSQTFVGDPCLYFYSVANNIAKEEQRRATIFEQWDEHAQTNAIPASDAKDDYTVEEYECFDRCFKKLTQKDQITIHAYYLKHGQEKIDHHRQMAERFGISTATLRVRLYRIREKLMSCIEDCLEKSPPR